MSWQKIDTAPKDGTDILISEGGDLYIVHWSGMWRRWKSHPETDERIYPTHWQPLPEPPK